MKVIYLAFLGFFIFLAGCSTYGYYCEDGGYFYCQRQVMYHSCCNNPYHHYCMCTDPGCGSNPCLDGGSCCNVYGNIGAAPYGYDRIHTCCN